ncbi:hypothetical protein HMPREF9016_00957 [Neisseria sp. oral taxon 014 str. F0314]|nr:hypothetical protein HMPREF9016_00957 [Neisseria sp. oral taxon 014 str. F0314]
MPIVRPSEKYRRAKAAGRFFRRPLPFQTAFSAFSNPSITPFDKTALPRTQPFPHRRETKQIYPCRSALHIYVTAITIIFLVIFD